MAFFINIVIPLLAAGLVIYYGFTLIKKNRQLPTADNKSDLHAGDETKNTPDVPKPIPKPARFFLGVFGVFGILFFLVAVGTGLSEILTSGQLVKWQTAPGTVFVSEIVSGYAGNAAHMRAKIRYRYHVAGREYIGMHIDSAGYTQSGINTHYVKKYPKGIRVKVFYNPDDPEQALLEPEGVKRTGYSALIVGILFLFLGIAALQAARGKINYSRQGR